MSRLPLLPLLLLGACVTADDPDGDLGDPGKGDGATAATIGFGDDWREAVQGTLRAGAPVHLRYDADRLPTCRGEQGGIPQWGITAYASVDGGAWQSVGLRAGADPGVVEGTLAALPAGDDLSV